MSLGPTHQKTTSSSDEVYAIQVAEQELRQVIISSRQ